jgi:hypothetical protein
MALTACRSSDNSFLSICCFALPPQFLAYDIPAASPKASSPVAAGTVSTVFLALETVGRAAQLSQRGAVWGVKFSGPAAQMAGEGPFADTRLPTSSNRLTAAPCPARAGRAVSLLRDWPLRSPLPQN